MASNNNNTKYNFSGKVCLITGSSSGIGESTAYEFAKYGCYGLTIHGRNAEALQKVSENIEKISNGTIKPLQIIGDLQDESIVRELIEKTLEKFKRLDILINNAAMGSMKTIFDEDLMKEFDKIMKINLRAPVQLINLATPHLVKTKGNIINVSSNIGIKPFVLVYSSAKAALDMITKTTAQELGPKGVRVNSVNPGITMTNFPRHFGRPNFFHENEELLKKQIPLNRLGQPEDIAKLIIFLASDDASNITGSIVVSDGGWLLGMKPQMQQTTTTTTTIDNKN